MAIRAFKRYYPRYRKLPRQFKLGRWHDRDVQDEHEWMRRNVNKFRKMGMAHCAAFNVIVEVAPYINDSMFSIALKTAKDLFNVIEHGKIPSNQKEVTS